MGKERKHWLKLSFSLKKWRCPSYQGRYLSSECCCPALCQLFLICLSTPASPSPSWADTDLPWTTALGCSTLAAKHYFVPPWLFLMKTCICSMQGNADPPKLPPFSSQTPCPGHRGPCHPEAVSCSRGSLNQQHISPPAPSPHSLLR